MQPPLYSHRRLGHLRLGHCRLVHSRAYALQAGELVKVVETFEIDGARRTHDAAAATTPKPPCRRSWC